VSNVHMYISFILLTAHATFHYKMDKFIQLVSTESTPPVPNWGSEHLNKPAKIATLVSSDFRHPVDGKTNQYENNKQSKDCTNSKLSVLDVVNSSNNTQCAPSAVGCCPADPQFFRLSYVHHVCAT
jgi:hypothetical protein